MPNNSRDLPAGRQENSPKLHAEIARQMVTLSTSGFGLVAALAWNSFIQQLFKDYINKWLPGNGSLLSLLLYAVIVTVLAVIVTYQLSKLASKLRR